ncbi:uncharacterized protein BDZ99DRAFT_570799 [Mytilinidion resinicola]|uniref:Uncharacterized protein n=1 Tax=Mytilinidion resinicola TaxID=574789 RepID=A0A6A6YMT1_9PEZI|nr:uncharacterized protein BDZ99DRAFT_570799 [Mytilinidion resinicola]KAF2810196.1 hypothetical protein BDZ99DRAFT_570799 [Mytilinidion resinicola]
MLISNGCSQSQRPSNSRSRGSEQASSCSLAAGVYANSVNIAALTLGSPVERDVRLRRPPSSSPGNTTLGSGAHRRGNSTLHIHRMLWTRGGRRAWMQPSPCTFKPPARKSAGQRAKGVRSRPCINRLAEPTVPVAVSSSRAFSWSPCCERPRRDTYSTSPTPGFLLLHDCCTVFNGQIPLVSLRHRADREHRWQGGKTPKRAYIHVPSSPVQSNRPSRVVPPMPQKCAPAVPGGTSPDSGKELPEVRFLEMSAG